MDEADTWVGSEMDFYRTFELRSCDAGRSPAYITLTENIGVDTQRKYS